MQSKFPRSLTQIIPASGTVGISASGNYYYILSATADVLVKPENGGSPLLHPAKTGVKNIDPFTRLEITNTTGAPNTVVLIVGTDTIYSDNR